MLDESPPQSVSTSIKDYTSPEKVAEVVNYLRKERKRMEKKMDPEKEKEIKEAAIKYKNQYLELVTAARKKLADATEAKKATEEKTKSIKQVTPVEIHEYNTVNASCSIRLLSNPHLKKEEANEDCVKEGKKRIISKQGDRSKVEEGEESSEGK